MIRMTDNGVIFSNDLIKYAKEDELMKLLNIIAAIQGRKSAEKRAKLKAKGSKLNRYYFNSMTKEVR